MATAASDDSIFNLVKVRTLELEEADLEPNYCSLVVLSLDMVMVVDSMARLLRLYSLEDGDQLAVYDTLESAPCDICICSIHDNEIQLAVWLETGQIEILSFKYTGQTSTITRVRKLEVRTEFDECQGVKYLNKKLLICGRKQYNMLQYNLCWDSVSITDGHVDKVNKICECEEYSVAYLSTNPRDDNMVYISCDAGYKYPDNTGVYGYRNSRLEFLYQHEELDYPRGITVDRRGYIFVCNSYSPCIHHLTEKGQLVTIYNEGMPSDLSAIFWEEQQELLYISSFRNNMITIYRSMYSDHQGLPREILNMDNRSIQLFEEALKDGKENVYRIRVVIVGQTGVGKTTLIKRLLGEEVDITSRCRTKGIDVHFNCCDVSLSTHEWTQPNKDSKHDYLLLRLAKVLNEKQLTRDTLADKEPIMILHQKDKTPDSDARLHGADYNKDTRASDHHSPQQDFDQNQLSTSSQQDKSPSSVDQRNLTLSNTNPMARAELERESQKKDPIREILQLLREKEDKLKPNVGKYAALTMWDFAGQYALYTTHQMVLTRRAIFLMVSDVSGQVNDLVEDECYFDSEGMRKCRVHELVEVWLNSIHSCAPTENEDMNSTYSHMPSDKVIPPPVILVGTHVDLIPQRMSVVRGIEEGKQSQISQTGMDVSTTTSQATLYGKEPKASTSQESTQKSSLRLQRKRRGTKQAASGSIKKALKMKGQMQAVEKKGFNEKETKDYRHEICERYFREIRSHLSDKPTRFHLVDEDFAIDNTVVDSKLEELKRKIVEVASQQPYWGEQIPTRWLSLEQELIRCKAAGRKVISRNDVENLNKEGAVPIEKSEELDLFLRFLHETGTVLYFNIEVLRENIVLDPVWLFDALRSLISVQPNQPINPADSGAQSDNPADRDADSSAIQKWSDFKEKGKLTLELVDAVWTKENNPDLHDNKEHILLLMEQLDIIAKPRSFNEHGEKVENYFLAPCMLRQESPREVISPEQDPQMVSTSVLCCIFKGKFLPPPVFHRLLAACVARWPVAKKKETSENLIFCGCCVFDLDLFHRLTLYSRNHIVFARITRMGFDKAKTPDAKLCNRVRKFITLNLSKIVSYLGQNLQYELGVQSPQSQGVAEDGIARYAPFEIWFAHEGHDPDAPITPEHMNHARLCIALVAVCGNALREILLTNCPVPHKDIYQAILASQAKLTGGRGRPLLNMDQSKLVFPDPRGRYTGTVEQFDVSLLYTLIRNVSRVPPPWTGWGSDPQDQPKDKSLGASVERIRLYRNDISGHSADGVIMKQNFEDYWNKINAVLHDIEDVIGRQVYSLELEKQRRQVISIYEVC